MKMFRIRSIVMISIVMLILAVQPAQAEYRWIGLSGWWDDATNWSPPGIPGWTVVRLLSSDAIDRTVTIAKNSGSFVSSSVLVDATGVGMMTILQTRASLTTTSALDIGDAGKGTYIQTGGTNQTFESYLGLGNTGNGSYDLSGSGSLSVSNVENVGSLGNGTFSQSGGTHFVSRVLSIAFYGGSTGAYNLSGGSLGADVENVGYDGSGTFDQSGGTNQVNRLYVGRRSMGRGSYNLSGSGILRANEETVGSNGYRNGTFTQTGGTNRASVSVFGSYKLQGGNLDAPAIGISTQGNFEFTGGRLSVDYFGGTLVQAGGVLMPGSVDGGGIGTTTIDGDYGITDSAAILTIALGGTGDGQFDAVIVGGTASLDGILEISILSSFAPTVGDYFDILTAPTIVGSFRGLNLPILRNGLALHVDYLLATSGMDTVRLTVTAVPEPTSLLLLASTLLPLLAQRLHVALD